MPENDSTPDPAGTWTITYTGRRFHPFAPSPYDVCLADIAHSLAHQCRYMGHVPEFYSVATHAVYVSQVVPPAAALWGLMHDAAEAYLGDVVRPLKGRMRFVSGELQRLFRPPVPYAAVEARVLRAIAEHFGLSWLVPPEVAVADLRMLATERKWFFPPEFPGWDTIEGVEPYDFRPEPEDPREAERRFLARFRELGGATLESGGGPCR